MRRGVVIVAAVAFAASANTLAGGFVWDDLIQIVANPWIRDPGRLGEAFATHVGGFDPAYRTSYYRPLIHVLNAGVHGVFGLAPWAYHLVSVVLHVTVSAYVFLLVTRWAKPVPALISTLLFAVTPVHSEAVAWLGGVTDLAFSLFVIVAVLALIDERPWVRHCVPFLFGIALLWKEPAMAFLPVAALVFAARREHRWRELATLAVVAGAYLGLRVYALGGLTGGDRNPIHVGASEAALTAVAVIAEYARILLFPVRLTPIHDFRLVTTLVDPRFVMGCAVLMVLGIAGWRARRSPRVVLGLAILVLPLLPALYIPALKDSLLAERYLYLPSVGATILLAVALERWAAARVPVAAAILVCAAGMMARNGVWRDSVSLWSDAVEKAPASAVAWENLGGCLAVEKRYGEAIPPLTRAVELDPGRIDARTNLALSLGAVGRRDEAMPHALVASAACPRCKKPREVLDWLLSR